MADCLIALGSNLGDRAGLLRQAIGVLSRLNGTRVVARSAWHETPAIGGPPGQGPFLNAAALISTSLAPTALLAELRRIESALGRERIVRWAARSLDLDLLLYDAVLLQSAELSLPHPRMAFRRFVLAPAAEVAPWMVHPESGWTVQRLLDHLNHGAELIAIAAADEHVADELANQIAEQFHLPVALENSQPGVGPRVVRWSRGAGRSEAARPKLLLAVGCDAGIDMRDLRRMLHLPATRPVAWISEIGSVEQFHEAVAAIQSVWPELAARSAP